jgi:hypothetical protein
MCYTVSDVQLTSPHIEQRNGHTAAAKTYVHQLGEPSAKRMKLGDCKNYTQNITNNEATTNTRQGNNNKETLKYNMHNLHDVYNVDKGRGGCIE